MKSPLNNRGGFRQKAALVDWEKFAALCRDAAAPNP